METDKYWILNLIDEQLEVHRDPVADPTLKFGSRYATITIHEPGDLVAPLALPKAKLDVSDLFV